MSDEYAKQIKSAEAVGALGNDLFGEKVNLYTGSTEFTVTDVSLRGNNSLPVAIGRRYTVQPRLEIDSFYRPFGDWDFDIPHLQGIFGGAWLTRAGTRRCNVSAYEAIPPKVTYQDASFDGIEYWSGNHLYVPGQGSQEMLLTVPENTHRPTDGSTYLWVTANHWYFSCIPDPNGGDAFLAIAPDGTRYWFDWLATRSYPALEKGTNVPTGMMASKASGNGKKGRVTPTIFAGYRMPRNEAWLMPTRVEDRFGNWVTYTYDAANRWQLKQILASDGRQLTVTYNASGVVSTVSDGTRTWTYNAGASTLSSVTLPDGSQWQYALGSLNAEMETSEGGMCDGLYLPGTESYTGTMVHPSGATGQFTFKGALHGRSYVTRVCYEIVGGSASYTARYAKEFAQLAIQQKTISGPGLTTAQWTYSYGPTNDSFSDECPTACPTTKTVEVSGPDSQWIRYTFGNKFLDTDGKLVQVETGTGPTNILRIETTSYLTDPTGQNYPSRIGHSPYTRSDRTAERHAPMVQRQTTQQGRVFTWQVEQVNGIYDMDQLARPTKVTKSSGQ
ncbi:hypothetical protein [Lysobacter sp. CFH 32150]|uniref:hypothetical protein n=1 Tax=Lysobacter sp. CFH 32150 TaxID=2927128 RepID=UPI001FA7656F|nr:hypothetical protein [Lysobacter sp. CFH 32150]MCI4566932.1 hypothetical protein [Lysobacter sp. CFH 32150]